MPVKVGSRYSMRDGSTAFVCFDRGEAETFRYIGFIEEEGVSNDTAPGDAVAWGVTGHVVGYIQGRLDLDDKDLLYELADINSLAEERSAENEIGIIRIDGDSKYKACERRDIPEFTLDTEKLQDAFDSIKQKGFSTKTK